MAQRLSRHHILYSRAMWESSPDLKFLRQRSGLIVPLPLDIHEELHQNVSFVPPLDNNVARIVLREFVPEPDVVDNVFNLMGVVEAASRSPRCDRIQRGVGELVIRALTLQLPYLEEGTTRL